MEMNKILKSSKDAINMAGTMSSNKNNTIKDETELYQQELKLVEKQIENIVFAII